MMHFDGATIGSVLGCLEACELGLQAGWRGDDPRTCPYDKLTQEWRDWHRWYEIGAKAVRGKELVSE